MDDEPKKASELDRIHAIWSRRKWLAIVVFVLPFAAALSVIAALPDLYRATATVLVERQQVPESFVRTTVTSEIETRLQTISQEILSRARLLSLIKRFRLYPELQNRVPDEQIAARMRGDIRLDVKSARLTTVSFALSYRGRDPLTLALVTNTLASFYVEENLRARERLASGTTGFLKTQLDETETRLEAQERQVGEFKRRYLGELPQQMPANLTTLEALNSQLRMNSDNRVRAADRRETLAAQLAEAESSGQVVSAGQVMGAPGPEPPATHLIRLKQALLAAQARYTDAHPSVTRLKDEIAAVEGEIANTVSRPRSEAAPTAAAPPPRSTSPYVFRLRESLHSAETELGILKGEEQRLRTAIALYQGRVENTPRREQEFQDISRQHDSTRDLYRSLLKRAEEAQISENMEQRQKGETFRLLDPALPSAAPVAPKRDFLLLMALGISLGLAGVAVVLAEVLDTSFHSAAELRAFTRVPVLVRIPRIATEEDRRRRRWRFQLAAAGTLLGLALVVTASYAVARGNEQMVRMLDRERS